MNRGISKKGSVSTPSTQSPDSSAQVSKPSKFDQLMSRAASIKMFPMDRQPISPAPSVSSTKKD